MAITTMDGLVAAIAAGQFVDTYEQSLADNAAGDFVSLWTAGGRPGAGATPATGAGAVPTNATAGAIPYTNPGSGTGYLARLFASGATVGSLILYDRLVHTSGLSGIVTTAQTVGTVALTRYTTGASVGAWLEFYTATGSTAVTASVSYTNQAGTSGQTGTCSVPASAKAGLIIPIALAAGDTGVRAVASVTLSATTGTAGNFGVTLGARLASVPNAGANVGAVYDYALLGLPIIQNNACMAYTVLASTTSTGIYITELTFVAG